MKKIVLSFLSTALVFTAASTKANAVVCLMPTPFCAIVMVGGAAFSVYELSKGSQTLQTISSSKNATDITAVVNAVKTQENGNLLLRMSSAVHSSPGYKEIVRRFQAKEITGNMSLESLYEFNPQMFRDLDTLAELVARNVKNPEMLRSDETAKDGNINWGRYAQLAADADALYSNTFLVK
jgi:hypothetical protein